MAGGIWSLQDKIRPGAYLRFDSAAPWNQASAGAGVVTMALEMGWGPEQEIIKISAGDFFSGAAEAVLGYPLSHERILAVRECLTNAGEVLLYRVNAGGIKANASLGALSATAKYPGERGNNISLSVAKNGSGFTVTTYVDGVEKERQEVTDGAPKSNHWVDMELSGGLMAVAATSLCGGSDGIAGESQYGAYFNAVKNRDWQVMALPTADKAIPPLAKDYIYELREGLGKKVQCVVLEHTPDYEGVISVYQGYVKNGVRVEPHIFIAWVAGISAGAEINESNTYRVIDGAEEIINPADPGEIEDKLLKGYFVIARRTDGTIVVEQDRNTLVTGTAGKSQVMAKNRVMRTLDKVANGLTNMFEANYIGVINNNAEGRDLFKQDIVVFLQSLAAIGAIQGFGGAEDIEVAQGINPDSVVVSLAICPVDAMEKLYITVEVAV
ncbi:MAG: phage tail sheath C-terminal domain-containing protein [Bacillota bacterium]|nr:phage tail sheath C-terminal domain-containing protein [Bacillota bacterium]